MAGANANEIISAANIDCPQSVGNKWWVSASVNMAKPNSPPCANIIPVFIDVLQEYFDNLVRIIMSSALAIMSPDKSNKIQNHDFAHAVILTNIPIDIKNKANNKSRKGRTSFFILCLCSHSASIIPAEKAPSAKDKSKICVNQAEPMTTNKTLSVYSSMVSVFSIIRNNGFNIH